MLNGFFFNTPIDSIWIGHQVSEVFKDKVYDPFFQGKKDLTVLDIGGNIGITSYYFSQFAKDVYTIEPAAEHYGVLCKMCEFNKLEDKVHTFQMAVSNEDGESTLFHQVNKTMFSLRPVGTYPGQETEKVRTIRLDTFFKEQKIEHVDFMKLDVEGSEADILCGDGFQNIADKIDVLFLEQHTWMGRNPNQLRDAIKMAGFTHINQIPNDAQLLICTK